MIGMLTGTVVYSQNTHIILDTHGVGYRVLVPQSLLKKINGDTQVTIYTHTHVREDVLELYGFLTHEDLRLFELLISVSGIGCRTALGIFSVGSRDEIADAIVRNNVGFFMTAPRLGKKNAQKIIIELRGKLGSIDEQLPEMDTEKDSDVIEALQSIGFSMREAIKAVENIKGKGETTEERIKLALRYLGK